MKTIIIRNTIIGDGSPKICIPLVGSDKDRFIHAAYWAREFNCDMYEFRGDYLLETADEDELVDILKSVREIIGHVVPLMFTLRSKEEGGLASISEKDYLRLNTKVSESGLVDIVDVELEKGPRLIGELISIAQKKGVFLLLSKHIFKQMPRKAEIISDLCKMQGYTVDMVKIALMVEDERDLLNLLDVSLSMKDEYADRPFTIIGMGEKGMLSRVSGEIFGSSLTFAKGLEASAPGQIDASKVRRVMDIISDGS